MSTQTCFIIFLGVVCLTTAAPPANTRQKRQTIFFEDELDESGNPNQGSDQGSDRGADATGSFRDTRAPHFGPAWHPPTYTHNHFGHWQSSHKGYGPDKFGWGYNPHDDFHGGSTSYAPRKPQQNSNSGKKPVNEALKREKRQLNRPAINQRPNANVAGSWNQNQPSWNEIGNNGNANNGPDWDNIGTGAWNGNQRPNNGWNGNQNNGAWNQRPSTNQNNGQWNGNQNNGAWNQSPNGNQNSGAWNQRPNGNQNNGAWNGNPNNGAWNQNPTGNGNQNNGAWNQNPNGNGNQRPNGNQNGNGNQNNGGSWNNQRPNGNQNGGTGSWNGNNNGGTPNASGNNNGNFGNSIDSTTRPSRPGGSNSNRPRPGGSRPGGSRPGGSNSQSIRPPIAIGGARPPSTPPPNCDCPSTSETNPVCGTDGSTYTNLSRLNCARTCGTSSGVQMQHYGACAATTPSPNSRRRG